MTFYEFSEIATKLDFNLVDTDARNRHYIFKTPDGQHILDAMVVPGSVTDSVNRWKVSFDGEDVEFTHPYDFTCMDFALEIIIAKNFFGILEKKT